jgi:hypothetical protein
MWRTVLIALGATAIVAAQPVAGAAAVPVTTPPTVRVTPKTGGPHTTFRLTLRSPFATGPVATLQRSETVDVRGPRRSGCVWSGRMALPSLPAQQVLPVALSPSRLAGTGRGASWCEGTFHGSVVLTERLLCGPPRLCPMLEIRPQTIARFSFEVTKGH